MSEADGEVEDEEKPIFKPNRTDNLLADLKIDPATFVDPTLPRGVFSHSQYGLFKSCGKAYEFKYVQELRSKSSGRMSKGVAVHAGIEHLLRAKMEGKPPSIPESKKVVADIFAAQAKSVDTWDEGEDAETLLKSSQDLLHLFSIYSLPKINPVAVERGFAKKIGDVPMLGWIDLIDEVPAIDVSKMPAEVANLAPRKRVIVDFKTTTKTWSETQLATNTQLTLYTLVEGVPDARVDQLIQLKSKVKLEVGVTERSKHDHDVLIDDVNEVATMIKKGIFPKTTIDSWKCNAKHCEFYSLCRGKKG